MDQGRRSTTGWRTWLIAGAALALGGCGAKDVLPEASLPVTVLTLHSDVPADTRLLAGVAVPYREADVGFEVAGPITAMRDVGAAVTVVARADKDGALAAKGDILAPETDALTATLPPGAFWAYSGEKEKTDESNEKLGRAFALSGLLIILVLIAQYNSFGKPFVVLSAVPLSLIGALLGLFLTGWPLGFMPSLGIISLAGVVINNAIILIDFIETGVRSGQALRPAVAEAGRLRMKPIVLTTLTTVGGMVPLALFGGPLWAGMAWAVIFGLSVSTVLTLLVVPTLYTLGVERLGLKIAGVQDPLVARTPSS